MKFMWQEYENVQSKCPPNMQCIGWNTNVRSEVVPSGGQASNSFVILSPGGAIYTMSPCLTSREREKSIFSESSINKHNLK